MATVSKVLYSQLRLDAPVWQVDRVDEPGKVERRHELVRREEGEVGQRDVDGRRGEDQRGPVEKHGGHLKGGGEGKLN